MVAYRADETERATPTKLQGELPLDDDHRARSGRMLGAELEAFLGGTDVTPLDRCCGRQALMLTGRAR